MGRSFYLAACTLIVSSSIFAGQSTPPGQSGAPASSDDSSAAAAAHTEDKWSRWLDLNTVSFSMRYRNYNDTDGFKLFNYGQQRSLLAGRVKLDEAGKYSVNFNVSSGRYFGWAYSDVIGGSFASDLNQSTQHYVAYRAQEVADSKDADPAGTGFLLNRMHSNGWQMNVRRLYLSASPVKQVTLEYGSLGIERGVNTEITSYDEDGYISGERLRIKDPRHLLVDELTVTYGYLGDFFTPNFFARGNRLLESNYHQFMATKKFGKRLKASVDYTWDKGTHTMREAALVSIPEARVIDSFRAEFYQRKNGVTFQDFDFDPGHGFALTGSKSIFRRKLQLEGGYASIDHDYTVYGGSQALDAVNISLNGDAYGTGRRFFTRATYKVTPSFSVFGFYTHAVNTFWNSGEEGFNAGLLIDLKKAVIDRL